ncbi:ABC transporter ATP-binding protein [Psychrobacillus soli]|uniref:sn-glycerol-3-phosphate ABC transporter ATP-binding protein UgpC n=1 Tax=Psychrobacillus soli TaxID=1543965 RepID=A0A544TFP4_9BACI|nr:sn-glycerol-3-phosphate ABC transporter ATP-binding protein UgpC [Psychrobacillus soli]TQR16275.1 sn-glycerol-3-phosphate ABC transporter ATP-binding protein UgpC [Psychrobacillus soli]
MKKISLKNITKQYDTNQEKILENFNLDIYDKEFIVLVGPSGCGKSTTLRMIAGLESITSGELSINEQVMNDVPSKDRGIAMVFQNYALFPHLTVFDNIAFGLKIRKEDKKVIKERVEETAAKLGLTNYLKRKPKDLSGGQRQRVALGRAIVRNTNIFLMDEPLSNLDAKLRIQMREEIIQLHNQLGTTTVYVTHDQTEAMTMASRIVVLKDGAIQQVGTPHEVYMHPANMFVASFIGSPTINFLTVKVTSHALKIDEQKIVEMPLDNSTPNEIIIGVRPEDIELVSEPDAIKLTIHRVEMMGADKYVYGEIMGQKLTVRVHNELDIQSKQHLHIKLNPRKVHLFEKETGKAIETFVKDTVVV